MAKKLNLKNPIVIIALILLAYFAFSKGGIFKGAITGNEIVTRTVSGSATSATIAPNTAFNVVYTVTGDTPPWGVSVEDTVSGTGCTPTGTSKFVITSDSLTPNSCPEPCTRSYTTTSSGSCTFSSSGNYMFGTLSAVNLGSSLIVSVGVTTCNTDADTNCNGCVSIVEFGQYVPVFRADPPNTLIMFGQAVSVWRSNPACP